MYQAQPPRSRKRRVLPILLILAVAFVVWRIFFGAPPQQGMPSGPTPVSVAPVINRTMTLWTEFSGRLEPVDIAEVRARVGGTIERVYFRDGAQVRRGDPLFQIDPRPYQAALAQAEGQLASADAELATARIEADRATKLMKANAIARTIYDERIARAKTAAGSLRSAKAAVDAARLNLQYTQVRAPITGKASRPEITVGNLVDSTPVLTTVVSQSPLYLSFEADEASYLSFIRGTDKNASIPVEMGLADEKDTPYKGKILSFDNRIDPDSGTIRGRAVFENTEGELLPGLFARVRIGTPDEKASILVNDAAINTDQSKRYVYVVNAENKAEYREVKLGGMEGTLRIITSGLEEGDTIAVNGLAKIRPGAEIKPVPADMETLKPLEAPDASKESGDAAAPTETAPEEKK